MSFLAALAPLEEVAAEPWEVHKEAVNQPRVPEGHREGGQWTSAGKPWTTVGVTAFRGNPRASIEDVHPYFQTARHKHFESAARRHAAEYDLPRPIIERGAGVWEGTLEPSVAAHLIGDVGKVRAWAARLGRRFNQDAVLLFTEGEGEGHRYSFEGIEDADAAVREMDRVGIQGGSAIEDRLEIVDFDGSLAPKVRELAKVLGIVPYRVAGTAELIERDAYDDAIEAGEGELVQGGRAAKRAGDGLLSAEALLGLGVGQAEEEGPVERLLVIAKRLVEKDCKQSGEQLVSAPAPEPLVQPVLLRDLLTSPEHQRPIDRVKVEQIARSGGELPPIVVNVRPDGSVYVLDGQHRAAAAALRGDTHIDAKVLFIDPQEEGEHVRVLHHAEEGE